MRSSASARASGTSSHSAAAVGAAASSAAASSAAMPCAFQRSTAASVPVRLPVTSGRGDGHIPSSTTYTS